MNYTHLAISEQGTRILNMTSTMPVLQVCGPSEVALRRKGYYCMGKLRDDTPTGLDSMHTKKKSRTGDPVDPRIKLNFAISPKWVIQDETPYRLIVHTVISKFNDWL